jgi:hypothetical protein
MRVPRASTPSCGRAAHGGQAADARSRRARRRCHAHGARDGPRLAAPVLRRFRAGRPSDERAGEDLERRELQARAHVGGSTSSEHLGERDVPRSGLGRARPSRVSGAEAKSPPARRLDVCTRPRPASGPTREWRHLTQRGPAGRCRCVTGLPGHARKAATTARPRRARVHQSAASYERRDLSVGIHRQRKGSRGRGQRATHGG